MKRVLVVDDQPEIRRLLRIVLSTEFEVLEAEDGEGALEAFMRFEPHVVLLDVMMPGELNGLQVLETIREDPLLRNVSVAMLTARAQDSDVRNANLHGADAYFIKPFSPGEVLRWVRSRCKEA